LNNNGDAYAPARTMIPRAAELLPAMLTCDRDLLTRAESVRAEQRRHSAGTWHTGDRGDFNARDNLNAGSNTEH
jgi:hypothetical protein